MADLTKILLAVDGSPCSEAAVQALHVRVRPERAEVRVLHAVEWLKHMPDSFRFAVGPNAGRDIEKWRRRAIQEAQTLVDRMSARLRAAGFETSTATPDADARYAIVEAASQWPADRVVMGSHVRRGLDRFLLGSVAESVMRHAPCSVEIVREPHPAPAEPRLSATVL
jgi:nucleotide-binding universal stress UspA family protein